MALIKKSNDIVIAHYGLSLNEQRLILALLTQIQTTDTDFAEYEFSFAELIDLLQYDKKFVYAQLQDFAKRLLSKVITLPKIKNGVTFTHWLSCFDVDLDKKKITISFDPRLKGYLLQLKACFTAYNIQHVAGFTCKHALRIYEICKQNERLGKRSIDLVELRSMLDLVNVYDRIVDFKKHVIKPSLRDINTYSDLIVLVTYSKTGRRITGVEFKIKSKASKALSEKQQAKAIEQAQDTQKEIEKRKTTKDRAASLKAVFNALSDEEKARYKNFVHFMAEQT